MLRDARACVLLGLIPFATVAADTYQRVIDKAAPGYEILRTEDMLQDEVALRNFLPANEIAKRKERQSPGLIVGRFNNDGFLDFAALVVNRSIKGEGPDRKA